MNDMLLIYHCIVILPHLIWEKHVNKLLGKPFIWNFEHGQFISALLSFIIEYKLKSFDCFENNTWMAWISDILCSMKNWWSIGSIDNNEYWHLVCGIWNADASSQWYIQFSSFMNKSQDSNKRVWFYWLPKPNQVKSKA